MSSIAEFYSQNLAAEVKKGSLQKAKSGGTVGRAPTGYLNVRALENGREIRTVALDPERAPLMQYAFERYSQGDINMRDLLAELHEMGLNSRPGPRTPSKPITLSNFHRLLTHPYYKGLVRYKGVTYPGNHEAIVDAQTWQRVQDVLAERSSQGKKDRKHRHYLKGTVWCGECGGRLIVSHNRGSKGKVYRYFICVERQKKRNYCDQRAIAISRVEQLVAQYYRQLQLLEGEPEKLRAEIRDELQGSFEEVERQTKEQERRRIELLAEQTKLLQAHYADAVPLDLMKSEQKRIENELAFCEQQVRTTTTQFKEIEQNLEAALASAGKWVSAYSGADALIRAQINDAVFDQVFIDNDENVTSRLRPLFAELLLRSKNKKIRDVLNVPDDQVPNTKTLAASLCPSDPDSIDQQGWGVRENDLVGVEGLEPPTLSV